MILFALKNYEAMGGELTSAVPGLRTGKFELARYDNAELHATVYTPVTYQDCVVLGSIAPPDEQLLSALLLGHTLRKEGAGKLTALLPYLAYSRQDKDKPGESLAAALTGRLLKAAGFDEVITLDVHSEIDKQLFPVPLISLETATLFGEAIRKAGLAEATIVAPDNGAIPRSKAVQKAAGFAGREIPYFEKQRIGTGIVHVGPIGKVGPQAVIVDDILDTGTTLLSACQKLVEAGVREIYVMVTHGLFTGERWKKLWGLNVGRIFCTDAVPLPAGLDKNNIETLSTIPVLRRQFSRVEEQDTAMAYDIG
jgi:ribose-phosphate pyrophosphokinase